MRNMQLFVMATSRSKLAFIKNIIEVQNEAYHKCYY